MRRRGLILLTVMVVVAMSALIGTTLILSVDAERSLIEGRLALEQSRSMAWSGVEAAMAELAGQRDELLAGSEPELTESWAAIGGGVFGRGVVRLAALDTGDLVRSEAAGIDLNAATAEMLGALPGIDTEMADAIVAGRSASPWMGIEELAQLDETRALLSPGGVSAGSVAGVTGDDRGGSESGVRSWLTAFAFDPESPSATGADGDTGSRIVLGDEWREVTADEIRGRLDAESAELVVTAMSSDNPPTTMPAFLRAMVNRGIDRAVMGELVDTFAFSPDPFAIGRIDINRAPVEVIAAIPGIGEDAAGALVDARERLPAESRRSTGWMVTDGDVSVDGFIEASEWVTTRTTVWRVRVEAGFEVGDGGALAGGGVDAGDPFDGADEFELPDADEFGSVIESGADRAGELRHRVVLEAVIDVSDRRPRVAYLRDVTSLDIARAQRAAFADAMAPGGLMPDAFGRDELLTDDAGATDDVDSGEGDGPGFGFGDSLFERSVGLDDPASESIFGDRGSDSFSIAGTDEDGTAEDGTAARSPGDDGDNSTGRTAGVDRRTGRWTSGRGGG